MGTYSVAIRLEEDRRRDMRTRMAQQRARREASGMVSHPTTKGDRVVSLHHQESRPVMAPADAAHAFWALVEPGDAHSCHNWTGGSHHHGKVDADGPKGYEFGFFHCEGVETTLVHRIAAALTFGKELPSNVHIIPICGNHLCCNVEHMGVLKKSYGTRENRLNRAVPLQEFMLTLDNKAVH